METYDTACQTPVSTFVQPCTPTMVTLDPARQTPVRTFVQPRAPTMSTPITMPGAPPKFRSEFSFASPVNQATPAEPTHGDRGRDLNERPTHENGNGIGGDTQLTMNTSSGLNNTATRHSSSPKVPIFDGTVSAHFRPWLLTVRGHCAPPMLDVRRESGMPGGISDRSGSEHVDWNEHGPTGRLCIPSCTFISQI